MADRYPLVVASSVVQELAAADNLDLTNSGIVNATSIGATNIVVSGIVTAGTKIVVGGGTTQTPSVTASDSDTGLFFPANDTVVIGAAGSERIKFTYSQDDSGSNFPLIAIDNPDMRRFTVGIPTNTSETADTPLLFINDGYRLAPVGSAYSFASGGYWPKNIGIGTSGRWNASLGPNLNASQLVIPYMKQNVWYKANRADVAGFVGLMNVSVTDADPDLGGTTTMVRFGMLGHYGPNTGFTTMSKRFNGSYGGDMSTGIGFSVVGSTTYVRWSTISGVTTNAVSMAIGFFGGYAGLKNAGAGQETNF